ncbi:nucleotide sugar dehydrogenase [Cryobacterium mesophilum]|uniref:Nucleotide sugar dehydrogenase n=1 Tax=Terrimesophilobacter mesophilus TaxID=433647 RepID=A0A4R8V8L1_9MICO|nr:nucleotide sugar dehydrogenase [Terrimesophilobacter mesophilus]MBB5632653.1 nucleotide sugar dehydrogenase [Terrimesophilobacter mesophilus]TFB79464.1 nucleotide sugar dehydrogenase [Terrimesophilobacter mesophilus]
MNITVVGMGKIGLPLAVQFASKGHTVFGADVNQHTVELINGGTEPFPGEAFLQEKLAEAVASGALTATLDTTDAVSHSDAVVIVVPLFVDIDGIPDFGWMDNATQSVGRGLKPGTLVSYETTLPVGTTRNRFAPMLEELSGLSAGVDFHLVFSPERVLTGRVFADLRQYPKLVGGIDTASTQRGIEFYENVIDFDERPDLPQGNGVWNLGSSEASEFAKLAETTYRDVNIGLANQFARFADSQNIDVYGVIDASNSQPYSHIHLPGIAVGGHCIPIYPQMYLWNDPDATIVRAARAANRGMPNYAVALLEKHHGPLTGQRVAVLGASYRGGVKETAFSGVFDVVDELKKAGAIPVVNDPMYTKEELERLGFEDYEFGRQVDAVIVQANHREYESVRAADVPGARTIIDGRRVTSPELRAAISTYVIGSASV